MPAAWPTILRMGWFRPSHIETAGAREERALLSARSTLVARLKDMENSMRGLMRGFGLRIPRPLRGRWDTACRDCLSGHPGLWAVFKPLLVARGALLEQLAALDKRVRDVAKEDPVCRRLMTVPGVGAIIARTFRADVEDPGRFASSRQIGLHFGLTPRRTQSGEIDRTGGISRACDPSLRVALFEAAHVMLTRFKGASDLKNWAIRVARRRGTKRAKVALARKIGVVLHRMWVDGTKSRAEIACT